MDGFVGRMVLRSCFTVKATRATALRLKCTTTPLVVRRGASIATRPFAGQALGSFKTSVVTSCMRLATVEPAQRIGVTTHVG